MLRRHLLGAGAAALTAPLASTLAFPLATPALAQGAWPNQPIRLVVPFAAGGPTDIPARLLPDTLIGSAGINRDVARRGGISRRKSAAFVASTGDLQAAAPKWEFGVAPAFPSPDLGAPPVRATGA